MLEQTPETVGIPRRLRVSERDRSKRSASTRVHGVPVALWLGLGVVAATMLRLAVAWRTPAPWIVADEPFYAQLARSFASTGHFAIGGQPFSAWSFGPLYPILIAPIYAASGSLIQAYFIVKAVNCLLMASAAIPAYFLGRRLLDPGRALIVAYLSVLIPSGIYTTKVMTESLAYPLFLIAVLAMVLLLERPTRRRELFTLGAIGAAALARGQLVVLLPAFVCAALLYGALDPTGRRESGILRFALRQLKAFPIMAFVSGGLLGAGVILPALGVSLSKLGDGHAAATATASPFRVGQSFVLHLAALDLYVGVLPFAAMAIMVRLAFKNDALRELRVICALTISLSCWLAAVAAKYLVADYPGSFPRIYDRYMFYVVPLLLVVFLGWIREGLPRPRRTAIVAAVASAALPAVIPYAHVLSGGEWGVSSSSVALLPWANIRFIIGTPIAVYPVLVLGGSYLAWVFARSENRDWLLFLVAANFVVLNVFALSGNSAVADQALRQGVGSTRERSWIDEAVGSNARVDALWAGVDRAGISARYGIWESDFFNQSVRRFYYLREGLHRDYPGDHLVVRHRNLYLIDGKEFQARYVLTDVKTPLEATKVAVNRAAGMLLYRVDGPVRLLR